MSVARTIPVFRPTEEEFSDFSKYVTSIQPIAEQFGICKIVPPEGWRPRISSYDDIDIEIPCPIRQFVHGKQGVYQVVNVMEKPMTLAQFRQASDEQFAKCFPKSTREGSDAEKFDIEELERRFWKNLTFHAPLYGADMLGTLFEDSEEEREEEEEDGAAEVEVVDDPPARGNKKNPTSPKRKRSDEEEGEKKERRHNAWNLGHLDTLLSQRLGKLLPGVTSPYLYFGMWKSLFACHTEDMDLYSINFLHFGKPKVWYGVPSAQKHRVDQVARLHFPMQFKECPEFLRHKSSMFSPSILKMGNVLLTHAVQQPGEFIITFPGAYHFGFNAGFNCAEAVNFALERWLDFGKKAKPCKCVADSVRIDVGMFINMVANGQELPELPAVPSPKRIKAAAPSKKKVKPRVAKRKAKTDAKPAEKPDTKLAAKPATKTKATAKAAITTVLGGRSMGMVTAGRMMPVPQRTSAAVPELPMFFEDMLGDDEDIPLFSDDELRSGDENDGGEYLEGSTSRHKHAKKPRRSKRVENKRTGVVADDEHAAAASEAPASSKSTVVRTKEPTALALPERPLRRKRTTPAAVIPEGTPGNIVGEAPVEPTGPKAQKKKHAVKRQNAKVESHFQKRAAKTREQPSTEKPKPEPTPEATAGVSTREYQGLKIIIRPPRADNRANGGSGAADTKARAHRRRDSGEPGKRARSKKSTTMNGGSGSSSSSHSGGTRKGKKAHPDLMPEGKEANPQHNREYVGGDHLAMTRERSSSPTTTTTTTTAMGGSAEYGQPSAYYAPSYVPEAPERRYGTSNYGHFLMGERTTHNQDGHFRAERAEQRPRPVHIDYQGQGGPDQQYAPTPQYTPPPTLRDFLSAPQVGYPQLPSLSVAGLMAQPMGQGLAPSAYGSTTMGSGGHDYSLALELERQKLKELKEKRQQLQQQRLEQQPQLQQLHQFIQAQRQLHQQPQLDSPLSSSATSLHGMPYSAGRYTSGLPPPVSSFSPTSTMSPYPSLASSSPYGVQLPSPLSSSPPSASGLPPPQHFGLPPHLAAHHHYVERLAPAPPPPADAAATGKAKLVPILPSPSPGLAAIYTSRSAPSPAPVAAPSTFPVNS